MPQADRAKTEEKLKVLKEALKGTDAAAIKKGMDELMQVSHKLAEEVYKASAAKSQPGAGEAGPGPGAGNGHAGQAENSGETGKSQEGVIDAEFKVDDDKK